jgi:hypothetical protein
LALRLGAPQHESKDNILTAEAVELQMHHFSQRKRHDGVPIKYEVPILSDFTGVHPAMQSEYTLSPAMQMQAEDFGVVKCWHCTEPAHDFSAASNFVVNAHGPSPSIRCAHCA